MENIIKLSSQQSLFNATNRLVDIVIPGNSGVYNLSETYVSIDMATSGLVTNEAVDAPQGQQKCIHVFSHSGKGRRHPPCRYTSCYYESLHPRY